MINRRPEIGTRFIQGLGRVELCVRSQIRTSEHFTHSVIQQLFVVSANGIANCIILRRNYMVKSVRFAVRLRC